MIESAQHPVAEHHLAHRIGWLRAAVLGANDGIISVSSLIVGVAAAPGATANNILLAGVAALVGGALSMAAGEYVSVSSQADAEAADLARERAEIASSPLAETRELAAIYEARGVVPALALQVAEQMKVGGVSRSKIKHDRYSIGLIKSTRRQHAPGRSSWHCRSAERC